MMLIVLIILIPFSRNFFLKSDPPLGFTDSLSLLAVGKHARLVAKGDRSADES